VLAAFPGSLASLKGVLTQSGPRQHCPSYRWDGIVLV